MSDTASAPSPVTSPCRAAPSFPLSTVPPASRSPSVRTARTRCAPGSEEGPGRSLHRGRDEL